MASYTRNQRKRKLLVQQRFIGLALILISAFILWFALQGTAPNDRDCTAAFLTAPIGLWLLFSRKILIVG